MSEYEQVQNYSRLGNRVGFVTRVGLEKEQVWNQSMFGTRVGL